MLETTYKELTLTDLHPEALHKFNRFQETTKTWVNHDGELRLEDTLFIDEWDTKKKEQVIESLRHCICNGGVAIGAYQENALIGFANVENQFFGSNNQYLELPYIHVSNGIRLSGIGRTMFAVCCEKARAMGAKKLYISTHPAQATQAFYSAMGCIPTQETNQEIFNREPLDLQLEYLL
ncbi:MAG: GNAT family N-acetyltransferase [Anaerolineaceae bacterium]|nr:GNAT family N-acetyltransferase [Anaerolineaceae bacterium]